jgi:ketohexokinase
VPNTLEVLQQLLTRKNISALPVLLAVLPNSASLAAQQIRSSLGPDVDLLHCFYRNDSFEAPSSYIIRSLDTDSRTIVNYNELEEMTVSEFQQVTEKLASRGEVIYHFEGRIPDVTARCMDYIRIHHPEARISVEVEKPSRDGLQALAQKADAIFYSKSWAKVGGIVRYEAFVAD